MCTAVNSCLLVRSPAGALAGPGARTRCDRRGRRCLHPSLSHNCAAGDSDPAPEGIRDVGRLGYRLEDGSSPGAGMR